MAQYTGKQENEVFVGNVSASECIPDRLAALKTARFGEQALDIDGKKIPTDRMRPLFIAETERGEYDRIMMRLTFGENYR